MDKMDIVILNALLNNLNAIDKMAAATQKAIYDEINISNSTLHRRLSKLVEQGYVIKGLRDRSAYTYYISSKGESKFKEVFQ